MKPPERSISIPLSHVLAKATERPQGYIDEVIGAGILINGEIVRIPLARYSDLVRKYSLNESVEGISRPCCGR